MKTVKIIYQGPMKTLHVPEVIVDGKALVIERDVPVDVPEDFAKSRLKPDQSHWTQASKASTSKDKKEGDS